MTRLDSVNKNEPPLLTRIPALHVFPVVENATLAAKATVGEAFPVSATVFREGHDQLGADAVLIDPEGREHSRARMYGTPDGLDRYEAWLQPNRPGTWSFRIETWSDPWGTWLHDADVKIAADTDANLMCLEGALLLERAAAGGYLKAPHPPQDPSYQPQEPNESARRALLGAARVLRETDLSPRERFLAATSSSLREVMSRYPLRDLIEATPRYPLQVDRRTALYGSWYEFFPRSCGAYVGPDGRWVSGSLRTASDSLERIAELGFTVAYLTPIHPIGTTFRKGRNNSLVSTPDDPGSPYGIGSPEGGHDALHPDLGTFADFDAFVARAESLGLQVALDLALQCSPDHPWVKEHPEWFTQRADGTIAYAENPPKKYQDIYPLNFDNDPEGIYEAIVAVVELWISHGVKIFRVDNPHTKPLPFWQRFLDQMRHDHPDVLFLAEAFTRPPMMEALGMVGFQQSYTYFTWRTSKYELEEYFVEVARRTSHIMRPAFWPTTHDILTPQMTDGGVAVFAARALLAATGAPTWGIYSGYELIENTPRPGFEEQIDNEKYQFYPRDWNRAEEIGITALFRALNRARAAHPALQQLHQISIHPTSDDRLVAFSKHVPARFSPTGRDDTVLTIISLDPHQEVSGIVYLNDEGLFPSLSADAPQRRIGDGIQLVDELDKVPYRWGYENFVILSPWTRMGHVFNVLPEEALR